MASKQIDMKEIENQALGQYTDYSNFSVSKGIRKPDLLPNRIAKFWLYINSLRSQKDYFFMVTRERILFDLGIKDVTLTDYISGTFKYKHLWKRNGGFINFMTLYGGNVMVVFAGYAVNTENEMTARLDHMRGSLYELTPRLIKERERGIFEDVNKNQEETDDDSED